MAEQTKFVYNADGVGFTLYKTTKPTKSGPKTYWLLEDFSTGKRRTLNNVSRKAAERRADQIRAAMVKGQASRMSLSEGQWQDVCIAREVLRSAPTGESLSSAIRSWVECVVLLGDKGTPFDAVKYFLANHKGGGPPPKPTGFAEAAKLYHSVKVAEGKSAQHCDNIRSRNNRLVGVLPKGVLVDALTAGELDQAVLKLGLAPKTKNEYRILLANFYKWAGKQNPPFAPKGFNPAKDMERYEVKQSEVEFLHVSELVKILAYLPEKRPDLVPLVILVCFAGLRPSEAVRLDWSEVGEDYIRLPGKKSKTRHSRQIPLQANLKLWLAPLRKASGLVCPNVDLEHLNAAIRHASGVRLSHDGMRHGYGTHRQRTIKNIGAVAEEMGNSISICRNHYVNAFCTEDEAREWFSIVPSTPSNIIDLAESREADRPGTSAF